MKRKLVGFSVVPVPGGYRMFAAFDDGLVVEREDRATIWTPVQLDLKPFVNGAWMG
jgi:hypothetical protein